MSTTVHDLSVLLRLRLRLLLRWTPSSAGRRRKFSRRARMLVVLLGLVVGVPALSNVASSLFASALPGESGRVLLASTLAWGLSMATLLVLFYAIVALIATLTFAGDLQLLLLTPVSPYVFVGEKLLSVSLSFAGLMLLTMPGIIGLGHRLHLGPVYDLTALAMVLLVPISPAALAMLIVVATLRWIPPPRARTLATVLGFVLAGMLVIGSQLVLSSSDQKRPTLPSILPSTWPGHALAAVGLGQPETALHYLLATALLAVLLSSLAIIVSGRFFATGWATYQEVGRRKSDQPSALSLRPPDYRAQQGAPDRVSSMRPAWRPLLGKEWLSLRRDPQRLAMLAYPVLLAAISSYQLFSKVSVSDSSDAASALSGTLYGMLIFVVILMLGSITAATVNGEGRSIYLLALAPLSTRVILFSKWAICVAPSLVIVEAILAVSTVFLHIAPAQALVAALAMAALIVALAGLGLVINLLWPRVGSDNPRLKASFTATIVSLVSELLIGVVIWLLLIIAFSWWPYSPVASGAALLGLLLVTGAITALSALVGPRLLQNLMTDNEI